MNAAALELRGVEKSFGATPIICGVDLQVNRGERHALIGPNGAGKSTLFHLITGRIPLSAGTIRLNGEDVTGFKPFDVYRRGLARSFQITNIFPRLSVYENLRCAVLWSTRRGYTFWRLVEDLPEVRERTDQVLERINLHRRRTVPAGLLSYAEQRALEIGIAIAGDPQIILLDEPTAGMSRAESEDTVQFIRFVTAGKTLLIVEHDMAVVFGLADRISVLVYGRLIATDTPERIKQNRTVQEAYLGPLVA